MTWRPAAPLLALAAALAGCATAGGLGPGAPPPREDATGGDLVTLPSGLRLAVLQRPGAPRFMLATSVACGGEDDPPGREGLAHLVEHLTFRARLPDGRVRRDALVRAGVAFNARTTADATELWSRALPDALDAVLAVEASRLAEPLAGLTEAALEAERAVVLRELAERASFQQGTAARLALRTRAFPGHPAGRPAAGLPETLQAATLDEARALAAACWRPERTVVALVGPWPAAEVAPRLRAALGAAHGASAGAPVGPRPPASPAVRPPRPLPGPPEPSLSTLRTVVRAPVLLLGWAVPLDGADQPRAHAARGLLTSRLGRRLGAEDLQRKVVRFSVDLLHLDRAGLMTATIELADEADAAEVLRASRDLLVDLIDPSAGPQGMRALRAALGLEPRLALDRLAPAPLLRHLRTGGGVAWPAEWEARVAAALPDVAHGLEAWAYRHLSRERSAAVLALPDPAAAAPALAADAAPADEEHGDREEEEDEAGDPSAAPVEPAPPPAAAPPAPLRRVLANGLAVLVAPRPGAALAEARLVVRPPGGLAPGEPITLPAFAMAVRGTRSDERWLHAPRLGARTRQRGTPGALMVSELARGEDLPRLVEDLARLPGSFELPAARLRVTRERMARAIEATGRDPTEQATRRLLARLFPGLPAGAAPDPAATGALGEQDVRRYLARVLRPEAATLLVAGDAPPEQVFRAAAGALGGWRGEGAVAEVAPSAPPAGPAGRSLALVPRAGMRQALLLVGWRLPAPAERDEAALSALARHLERTLDEALRARGGVSYGAHAVRLDRSGAAALVLETVLDAPAAPAALRRAIAALASVVTSPPGPAVVARLAREVARDAAARADGVGATVDALEADLLAGRPPGASAALGASAATLDGARLAAAAAALVGREQVVVLADPSLLPALPGAERLP